MSDINMLHFVFKLMHFVTDPNSMEHDSMIPLNPWNSMESMQSRASMESMVFMNSMESMDSVESMELLSLIFPDCLPCN